jgi:hypothetical protein
MSPGFPIFTIPINPEKRKGIAFKEIFRVITGRAPTKLEIVPGEFLSDQINLLKIKEINVTQGVV